MGLIRDVVFLFARIWDVGRLVRRQLCLDLIYRRRCRLWGLCRHAHCFIVLQIDANGQFV